MRDFNKKDCRDVPCEATPYRKENDRSWLANAIINSIPVKSVASDPRRERQTARAPAIVRYFGRTRRAGSRSASSLILRAAFLSTGCLIAIWLSESDAQARCGEGKTTGGQCVDSRLAETARQTAVIFSQPKISQTAYPVLPSGDANYRYPNQLNPDPLKPAAIGVPVGN